MASNETSLIPIEKKSHRCASCGKGFSRQDHLRRHSLSHTGGKPYSCLFCRQDFARSDRLRDHYADCPARGDREIPKKTQRGRRRRACAACTASKLRCDGGIPCACCQRRNLDCDISRVNQPEHMDITTESSIIVHHSPAVSESSDTSSIKALIDGGTRGFTEGFNLPRVRDVSTTADSAPVSPEKPEDDPPLAPALPKFQHHIEMDFQLHNMLDFPAHVADLWAGPLGNELPCFAEHSDGHLGWPGSFQAPELFHHADLDQPSELLHGYKTDSLQVALMKDMMLHKAREMHTNTTRFDELSAIIQSLFCHTKVEGFVRLFFQNFHPSCPIFHIPTFDADAVATELLLAIFCFGAIYAHDGTDRLVADRILDLAEQVIFSTELYMAMYDANVESKEEADPEEAKREWKRFEQLQAGFLIATVQYWAGARRSKARVMEYRFCGVIKAARDTGLTQIRRVSQDRISEQGWIRKEIRLRTMCMIRSLDCAFLFYSNFPCRLTLSEMNVDMPCDSSVFNSEHPFAEDNFRFSRAGNLASIFEELFSDHQPHEFTNSHPGESPHTRIKGPQYTRKTQTVIDLFISIHLLYVFVHNHLQLRRFVPQRQTQQKGENLKPGQPKLDQEADEVTSAVKNALKRWHALCSAVRGDTDGATLSNCSLLKLSYNFWLILHLFVDKGKGLDLAKPIDVEGEDKLTLLKSLM